MQVCKALRKWLRLVFIMVSLFPLMLICTFVLATLQVNNIVSYSLLIETVPELILLLYSLIPISLVLFRFLLLVDIVTFLPLGFKDDHESYRFCFYTHHKTKIYLQIFTAWSHDFTSLSSSSLHNVSIPCLRNL